MGRVREQGSSELLRLQTGETRYWDGRNPVTVTPFYDVRIQSHKICVDEIHPDYPKTGGPLSIRSLSADYNAPLVKTGYINPKIKWENTFEAERVAYLMSGALQFPSDGLAATKSYGPDGWARYAPNYQSAGLAQFLAELRDFPKLFKGRLDHFRDLGNGYLNYAFGWLPFLRDCRDFFQTMSKIDNQLLRLKQANGKWIKSGGTLLETDTAAQDEVLSLTPANGCTILSKKRVISKSERVWFSASFRFYIPDLEKKTWGISKAHRRIWGLEVTPLLLWELVPYSWLADWCSNASAAIKNITNITADNLVAQNAYVMRHEQFKQTGIIKFRSNLANEFGNHYTDNISVTTLTSETKCRSAASPYGFRLDWPDFTPFQLSILGALGISRL